jgi:hypothetical protein
MNCWNCGYEVEDGAKVCRRCESALTESNPDALRAAQEALEQMAPGDIRYLQELAGKSNTAEDFANAILVGPCAKCGSENVGCCEDDPDYHEPLLGRCFACGAVWCTECGHVLETSEKTCPRMAEHDEELEQMMEEADLPPDEPPEKS